MTKKTKSTVTWAMSFVGDIHGNALSATGYEQSLRDLGIVFG